MRPFRALGLLLLGVFGGIMAAAAFAKRALPSRGDAGSDELGLVSVYEGLELESTAGAFSGGSMLAWFGGIAVDLRGATIAPEGASLTVHAFFGGVAIRVPEGWRVESNARAIAGGVATKGSEDESAPTLRVDGYAVFGGIAVGPRPTAPEAPPG